MTSEERISALVERLDADSEFAAALEGDVFTTLRETGFDDLVAAGEQERDRIGELIDEIYRDDAFRRAVEEDPTGELGKRGIPELAIGPVLVLAGAPDEVVDRATADVEAHIGRKQLTVAAMAAVLGSLAFAQQASAGNQTAQANPQVNPAAQALINPASQALVNPAAETQVNPAAHTQVNPAAHTQVNPATEAQVTKAARVSAQVTKPAQVSWQGLQTNRLKAQTQLVLQLRTQGLGQ